jgi:polyisoprenyl-phosphate glycosyltransferase
MLQPAISTDHPQPLERPLPTLSCVVPCYNEATNLARLLPLLSETLAQCSPQWEIILIDDGSHDLTALLLAQWAQRPGFRFIQLSRNFGKEAALMAGLENALGDVVITMDADLQHAPALLPTFVKNWQSGADVVYAVRENRHDEHAFKRIGTRWFYTLLNAADRFEVPPDAGDFRLMDRKVVNALLSLPERNRFMKGLYSWVGFAAIAVPYTPAQRKHGHSHFNYWQLIKLSLDGLTAFTTWPLRAIGILGFVFAALAFVYGIYLTGSYFLYGHQVNGWTTIVVSLMLFAGVHMLSLGILGEYIGRIFEEVKARPLYVIKHQMGQGLKRLHCERTPSADSKNT